MICKSDEKLPIQKKGKHIRECQKFRNLCRITFYSIELKVRILTSNSTIELETKVNNGKSTIVYYCISEFCFILSTPQSVGL